MTSVKVLMVFLGGGETAKLFYSLPGKKTQVEHLEY